jgi:histidinol-phosphate aminotransferase
VPLRPALSHVRPYRPQRPLRELQAELGLGRMVKLASNEGAFGPLPAAVAAFQAAVGDLNRYPDGGGLRLREALAERHGVAPAQIVLGNGADELIRLCAVATLDAGDRAVLPWPSFPSYFAAAACCGAEAVKVPLRGRTLDLEALLAASRRPGTKLVYLATPNNPTGTLPSPAELRRVVDELPAGVLCVLDEAYAEYAEPEPEGIRLVAEGRERLCSLRTFSKVYGLAALRIGYAVASPDVADALDRVRPVFNVNQPAQEAALASLHEPDAVAGRVAHARHGRARLLEAMRAAGLEPEPSQANFVYAEVPGREGAEVANALLSEGVIVRALAGFGAPGAIRVTAGTDEENELFAAALGRVMAQAGARAESSRL